MRRVTYKANLWKKSAEEFPEARRQESSHGRCANSALVHPILNIKKRASARQARIIVRNRIRAVIDQRIEEKMEPIPFAPARICK